MTVLKMYIFTRDFARCPKNYWTGLAFYVSTIVTMIGYRLTLAQILQVITKFTINTPDGQAVWVNLHNCKVSQSEILKAIAIASRSVMKASCFLA